MKDSCPSFQHRPSPTEPVFRNPDLRDAEVTGNPGVTILMAALKIEFNFVLDGEAKKIQKHDLALWGMKLSITHCDRIRCKRRTAHLLRAFLPCSRCVPCYPQPNGCTAQWITFISQSRKIASTRNQSGFHQTALVQGLSGKAVFLTQPRILSSPHLGTVRRR